MKEKIVVVDWMDSSFEHGWIDKSHVKKLKHASCRTVGFLVNNSKKNITLSMGYSDCNSCHDCISIPRVNIANLEVLKGGLT